MKDTKLLYFTAPWCVACNRMKPLVDKISKQIQVDEINIERFRVRSLPTFAALKGEEVLDVKTGSQNISELLSMFGK